MRYRPPSIQKLLAREGLYASRQGIRKFVSAYRTTGCINRKPGSGRPSKVCKEIKKMVNERLRADDETTAHQLHGLLQNLGYKLSIKNILRCRSALGWTYRGSAYCQMIREPNKLKRLEFANSYKDDDFENVIYTDEETCHEKFGPCKKWSRDQF